MQFAPFMGLGPSRYTLAVVCACTCTRRNDHAGHLNYVSRPIRFLFSILSVASLFSRNVTPEADKKFNFPRQAISFFKSLLFFV